MKNEITFSDHVEIITNTYDILLYSVYYSNQLGFYLYCEDDNPIVEATLIDNTLTLYYFDGKVRIVNDIMAAKVDDSCLKKINCGIEGNLLRYDREDALFYNLDMTKAFDYKLGNASIRKRSL